MPVEVVAVAAAGSGAGAGAAASAGATTAGAASSGGAAGAGAGASSGLSPSYASKLGANSLDGLSSGQGGSDLGSFQRVNGCHDGSSFTSPGGSTATPELSQSFTARIDHGPIRLDLEFNIRLDGKGINVEVDPTDSSTLQESDAKSRSERDPFESQRQGPSPEQRSKKEEPGQEVEASAEGGQVPDPARSEPSSGETLDPLEEEFLSDEELEYFDGLEADPEERSEREQPQDGQDDGEDLAPEPEPEDPDTRVHRIEDVTTPADLHDVFDQYVEEDVVGGVEKLKEQLGEYVDEGGSPLAAAAGATVLDVLANTSRVTSSMTSIWTFGRGMGEDPAISSFGADVLAGVEIVPAGRVLGAGAKVIKHLATGVKHSKKYKSTAAKLARKKALTQLHSESLQRLVKRFGAPEKMTYRSGRFGTYPGVKQPLTGKKLQVHHMVPQWVFKYGPKNRIAMKDYVPAMPLPAKEHLRLMHGKLGAAELKLLKKDMGRALTADEIKAVKVTAGLDNYLKHNGIFYNKRLTVSQQDKAIRLTAEYFRKHGMHDHAAAVMEFRAKVFQAM